MSIDTRTELRQYTPLNLLEGRAINPSLVRLSEIKLAQGIVPHFETTDFELRDPWSRELRKAIREESARGGFKGKPVTEFGAGDGRNLREIGTDTGPIVAVDVDEWRLVAAAANLTSDQRDRQIELWHGDAVDYLSAVQTEGKKIAGRAIMCLPQSPAGLNAADKIQPKPNLTQFQPRWGEFGLTLNAAVLTRLSEVATEDLRTMVIVSNRVLDRERAALPKETGWEVERQIEITQVQQDPDTPIGWVERFDDGFRFFETVAENGDGTKYCPIPAKEAENRRATCLAEGHGRETLNVYHGLTIWRLAPAIRKVYTTS